jgi:NADH dehydrogenase FAD-containing subunit
MSRGVEILLKTRIAGCDDDHVRLSDGATLPTQTLI